jgi:hypothetical protein
VVEAKNVVCFSLRCIMLSSPPGIAVLPEEQISIRYGAVVNVKPYGYDTLRNVVKVCLFYEGTLSVPTEVVP